MMHHLLKTMVVSILSFVHRLYTLSVRPLDSLVAR